MLPPILQQGAPRNLSRESLNTEAVKNTLREARESLRQRYQETGNGAALLLGHCRLVDEILRQVWQGMGMHHSLALLAVGGYGRHQLFPYSDIDLLVLLPQAKREGVELDGAIARGLEQWVRLLWDIGLEIGHSVRSLDQCAEEAAKDITVQTSLLEARQLSGNKDCSRNFSVTSQAASIQALFLTPSCSSKSSAMSGIMTRRTTSSPI